MAAVAAIGALALGLTGCPRTEAGNPPPTPVPSVRGEVVSFPGGVLPTGVRVEPVAAGGEQQLRLPGRLAWDDDHTTRVWAPYAGRIERIRVNVGDRVKRGQPLADVVSADIGQAQADLQKALADESLARSAQQRAKELADQGIIARKELQQAETDLARAGAEATRARARLGAYGVSGQGVTQGMALAARIDGIVVERNGNPGTEVRTDVGGPPLFTISDPTVLIAVLDLDETQLSVLKPGQAIELITAAWPDERFAATVLAIGESVDPSSRTVKVRARVANPKRQLKAEMFVTGLVTRPSTEPMVNADAVFQRGEQCYVFVQREPGRFERRAVTVRAAGPKAWQVTQGLAAGDKVVVGGGLYLNQMVDAAR